MSERRERRDRWLSRGVQAGFLLALVLFWYLGTTYWGVSHLLLPNPVKVWHECGLGGARPSFWRRFATLRGKSMANHVHRDRGEQHRDDFRDRAKARYLKLIAR